MLRLVISGGQTGADQAAWRAARALGIATGGTMPKGYMTEAGPQPGLASDFGAVQCDSGDPAVRTRRNVRDADMTVFFGDDSSPGGRCTYRAARALGKHYLPIPRPSAFRPAVLAGLIRAEGVGILNVAGHRESTSPGIGDRVEKHLIETFRELTRLRYVYRSKSS